MNDRPVVIAQTANSGTDCLVLDMWTGNFLTDRSYYAYVVPGSGKDVDQLTAEEFSQFVAAHRGRLVRRLAERMCAAATTSEADLLEALRIAVDPPPLGGATARVRGGDIPKFEVELSAGTLTRAHLDASLGESRRLPPTGPFRAVTLWYGVDVPGPAHRCSAFADFEDPGLEPPATSSAARVMLRLDPAAK